MNNLNILIFHFYSSIHKIALKSSLVHHKIIKKNNNNNYVLTSSQHNEVHKFSLYDNICCLSVCKIKKKIRKRIAKWSHTQPEAT